MTRTTCGNFPIKTAGVYYEDFKKAGPDGVIFDRKGVNCQVITHYKVKKNDFRECWLVPEEEEKAKHVGWPLNVMP